MYLLITKNKQTKNCQAPLIASQAAVLSGLATSIRS